MSFPRPLTASEKSVLKRVLELAEAPEIETLRRQAEVAVATEPCPCVCPSVRLAVDSQAGVEPIPRDGRLEAEAYYETGAVMVWADDGWLSNLEVWWWSDDPPTEFPPPDTLRPTPNIGVDS